MSWLTERVAARFRAETVDTQRCEVEVVTREERGPVTSPGVSRCPDSSAAPFCSLVPRTKTSFVTDCQCSITNNMVSN